MSRKEFSGSGRVYLNGTLIADATDISVDIGGDATRIVTTASNTGEVISDPTKMTANVQHAVPKTGTAIRDIARFRESQAEVTLKLMIGNNVRVGKGKVTSEKHSTSPGKSEFSFTFQGDVQSVG